MSWGEDVRCLFCDDRLPLYRKLTDGQFCSAGHRKAYWVEQQRLGVERLHQFQTGSFAIPASVKVGDAVPVELPDLNVTATDLPVHVPAHSVNEISSVSETLETVSKLRLEPNEELPRVASIQAPDNGMPVAGFLQLALRPTENSVWAVLAADPIEYEIQNPPLNPTLVTSARRNKRELAEAGLVSIPKGSATDCIFSPALAPSEPNWTKLVAIDSTVTEEFVDVVEPAIAHSVQLPLAAVDHALDATKRAEATDFPQGSPAIPQCDVVVSDELDDAIGALIPALTRQLRLAAPASRSIAAFTVVHVEEPSALQVEVPRSMPVRAPLVAAPVELGKMTPLPRWAIDQAAVTKDSGVYAVELAAELGFVTPQMPVASQSTSVSWGSVQPLPWSVETCPLADWHSAAIGKAAPEAFSGEVELPLFQVQREIASFKGSAQQRELVAPPVRDFASSRAVQVPRVYFAPQPASSMPLFPVAHLEPVDAAPSSNSAMEFVFAPQRTNGEAPVPRPVTLRQRVEEEESLSAWQRLKNAPVAGFWRNAPRDLKWLAIALPLLIGLAIQPSLPKVRVSASVPNPEISRVVETQWNGLRRNIMDRAGVELSDDFRSGLEAWQSKSELTETWSYDAAGFVKPGPLALYEPSMKLTDYQVQFLGQITKKALGFVYRANDLENYYVAKLVVLRSGPLPIIGLQRYAVINGKPGPMVQKVMPVTARNGMFYRVRLDVEGEYFALSVQGHLVDFWSDSRWKSGGVGFFSESGEESRVRWVQVSHQYDALGRLCAYLAPYSVPGSGGGLKE